MNIPSFFRSFDRTARLERGMAYSLTLLIVAACLLLAIKSWETNDDIGMMMVSQGYGIARAPSAGVVFSNVIWGWLLAHTPNVAGIDGYTLLNYAALLAAAASILASLIRAGTPSGLACAMVLVILVPTLLTPQFTLLAGYMAVAGFAVLLAWRDQPNLPSLTLAGFLLLTAALIRQMEMLFIAAVALPFLIPWIRQAATRNRWLVLAAVLLLAMGTAKLVDHAYYSDSSWSEFRAMNTDRVSFTDYRLGLYYTRHPKVVRNLGLEPNDITLISHWFYADPKVFDPAKFDALRSGVAPIERIKLNISHLHGDLKGLATPQLLLLCGLLIGLVTLLRRRLTVISASIAVVLGASVALCFMGHMGQTRVYMPVLAAIPMLYLCACAENTVQMRLFGLAALVAAIGMSMSWISPRIGDHTTDRRVKAAVCALPTDRLKVVWGARYWPYIALNRPGQREDLDCASRFYALGSLQLAPYSLDTLRQATGFGDLAAALLSGKGIYLFTGPERLPALVRYFADHYHKTLSAREIVNFPHLHGYAVEVSGDAQATGLDPETADDDEGDPPG